MADISLQRPEAGQVTTWTPQAQDRLVFEFASNEATLSREGDTLLIRFNDDGIIQLTDFYVAYTAENMPTFLIEGNEVAGEEFFAALGEELMPAAGGTAQGAQGGGTIVDTISGELFVGLDRLSGLDQSYGTGTTSLGSTTDSAPAVLPTPAAIAPNTAPVISGIIIHPENAAPEGVEAHMTAYESGVGRDQDSHDFVQDESRENEAYTSQPVTGKVVASDTENDTLTYGVVGGDGLYGTFVIDAQTGEFTYTLYAGESNLNSLAEGHNAQESFTITVSDGTFTVSTTIVVNVQGTNDKPEIIFDATDFSVTESDFDTTTADDVSATGHIVVLDPDTTDDTFIDQSVRIDNVLLPKSGEVNFDGDYGRLTVDSATGEYTYTLYTPKDGDLYNKLAALSDEHAMTESFSVVTKDAQGASDAQTLSFTVQGTDNGVTVKPVDPDGPDDPDKPADPNAPHIFEHSFDEDDLAKGSDAEKESLTVTKALSVQAPDGLTEVLVDGTVVAQWDEENAVWTYPNTASTAQGIVSVVVSGNLENGYTVQYTYTFTTRVDHTADGEDSANTSFELTFKDVDGTAGSAEVGITIVDDVPTATVKVLDIKLDDTTTDTVEFSQSGVASDVFVRGADGVDSLGNELGKYSIEGMTPTADGTYTFAWGTVKLNATTGEYTITAKDGVADKAIFDITYTDKDNDSAKVTISADINNSLSVTDGKPHTTSKTLIVHESNLEGGTEENATKLSATGSFTIDSVDGVQSLTMGDVTLAVYENGVWTFIKDATDGGLYGDIKITGISSSPVESSNTGKLTVNFEYTLTDKAQNAENTETDASVFDSFHISVNEKDSTAETTITVQVVDDEPKIMDADTSTDVVDNPHMGEITTATKSLIYDLDNIIEFGADGKASSNAITFFVTDTDANASTGYHLDGSTLFYNGVILGTVSLDSTTHEVTITQDAEAATQFKGQELPTLNLGFTITDGDGDTATGALNADFDFDYGTFNPGGTPDIGVHITSDADNDRVLNTTEFGDGILQATVSFGGDVSQGDTVYVSIEGKGSGNVSYSYVDALGKVQTITPQADGSIILTPDMIDKGITVTFPGDAAAKDVVVSATVTDKDGNSASAKDDASIITSFTPDTNNESNVVETDDDTFASNELVQGITLGEGVSYTFGEKFTVMVGEGENAYELGYFTKDEGGNVFFTQTAPYVHTDSVGNVEEHAHVSVALPVQDAHGNGGSVDVTITVGDSIVDISSDITGIHDGLEGANVETDSAIITSKGSVEATLAMDSADTITELSVNGQSVTLEHGLPKNGTSIHLEGVGTVTFGEKGAYTFVPHAEYDGTAELTFTATDKDGDTQSITESITVKGTSIEATPVAVAESGLVDDSGAHIGTGTVKITTHTAFTEVKVGDEVLATWDASTGKWLFTAGANVSITGISGSVSEGFVVEYTYTLTEAVDGDLGKETPNTALEAANQTHHESSFEMSFGDEHSVTIDVSIADDTPAVENVYHVGSVSGDGSTVAGLVELDFGADKGAGSSITLNGVTATFDGSSWSIAGTQVSPDAAGSLTLNFGDVSLTTTNEKDWLLTAPAGKEDTKLTLTDADGDVSSGTITFTPKEDVSAHEGKDGNLVTWIPGTDYNVSVFIDVSTNAGQSYYDGAPAGTPVDSSIIKADVQNALETFINETLFEHAQKGADDGTTVNFQLTTYSSVGAVTHEFSIVGEEIYQGNTKIYPSPDYTDAADAILKNMGDSTNENGDFLVKGNSPLSSIGNDTYQDVADFFNAHEGAENKLFFMSAGAIGTLLEGGSALVEQDAQTAVVLDVQNDAYRDGQVADIYELAIQFDISGYKAGDIWQAKGTFINEFSYVEKGEIVLGAQTEDTYLLRLQEGPDGKLYLSAVSVTTAEKNGYGNMIEALGDGSITAAAFTALSYQEDTYFKSMEEHYGGITQDIKVCTPEDANDLFTPATGHYEGNALGGSFASTADAKDVIFGGMSQEEIIAAVATKTGIDADLLNFEVAYDYVISNPLWFESVQGDDAADSDIILSGQGADLVFGQGGNDVLLGDGSSETMKSLADSLGLDGDAYKNALDTAGAESSDVTPEEANKLLTDLSEALQDANNHAGIESTLSSLEGDSNSADSADTLFGGAGHDVLVGLGGNDVLHGGEGNDILFGGSGDDYLLGGMGQDSLFGGQGSDLMQLGDLSLEDVIHDTGTDGELDLLLAGANKGELDAAKTMLGNGSISGVEVLVFSDSAAGGDVDEVLESLGISQEGSIFKADDTWTKGATNNGYTEYTNGDDTILLQQKFQLETM